MKIKSIFAAVLAVGVFACNQPATEEHQEEQEVKQEAEATPEEPSGEVFFVNLEDGATVTSPVVVQMGVKDMQVEPAGEDKPGFGHHHIIIDGAYLPAGELVPMNETNIHYGKGQTADTLELSAGEHTLTLQFANGLHQSYGEALSKTITVTVE